MKLRQVLWGTSGGAALAVAVLAFGLPAFSSVLSSAWGRPTVPQPGRHVPAKDLPVSPPRVPASDAPSQSGRPRNAVAVASWGDAPLNDRVGGDGEPHAGNEPVGSAGLVEPPVPLVGNSRDLHPDAFLGALSKETRVFEKPDPGSKVLGIVRTGSLLRRAVEPAGHEGCKEGWYHVEPEGYVCVGRTATLDLNHPVLQIASYQPDRSRPMPYVYGRSRYPTPPLYTRLPTHLEQEQIEPDLRGHLRKDFGSAWAAHADTPPPSLLANGERIPRPFGYPLLERDYVTGRALSNSAFAFIDMFESDGRRYGLTADLSLLPLDRLTVVEASEFSGRVLADGQELRVAFVRGHKEHVYQADPVSGQLAAVRPAAYRESFLLTGRSVRAHGTGYWETTSGQFLRESEKLVRIEPRETMPPWAAGKRSWIEVSILKQTLVAYEGTRPVFATLVSTGRDGIQDPLKTHSTVQGVFLIHTKHVTATMSGNTADDEFDLRDVPYVQYFHQGYAFHAAFWHDGFGSPRSHGCINLSPADARYLFTWTDPPVPMRWHSALSRSGTLVHIHP